MSHALIGAFEPGLQYRLLQTLLGITLAAGLVGQLALSALWLKS